METPRQNGIAWRITNSLSPFARSQQKLQGCTCSTRNTGAWPEQKSKLETKKATGVHTGPPLPSPTPLSPHPTQPSPSIIDSRTYCPNRGATPCNHNQTAENIQQLPAPSRPNSLPQLRANHGYWNRRSIYRLSGLLVPGDPTKIYIFVIRSLSIIHIANLKRTWKRSGFLRYMSKDLIFVFLLGHVLQFLKNRKYETNKCNLASKDHVSIFWFIIIMWNIHNS